MDTGTILSEHLGIRRESLMNLLAALRKYDTLVGEETLLDTRRGGCMTAQKRNLKSSDWIHKGNKEA